MIKKNIQGAIEKLGEKLVKDEKFYQKFPDIVCDVKKGILPRCLTYENRNPKKRGCVFVGVNPGNAKRSEKNFFKKMGASYKAELEGWEKGSKEMRPGKIHPYYRRLRVLSKKLGFSGPILWTELVKCESKRGKQLSIQTIRDDIHRHLFNEIEQIPSNWPLIGVGSRAYEILSFYFADRLVIGIPHPTSSRGQFSTLMDIKREEINLQARKALRELLKKGRNTIAFRCHGSAGNFI